MERCIVVLWTTGHWKYIGFVKIAVLAVVVKCTRLSCLHYEITRPATMAQNAICDARWWYIHI